MSKELDAVEAVYPKLVVCDEVTKRPPEMVKLVRTKVIGGSGKTRDGYVFPAFATHEMVDAEIATAAIRSLRVKLFRERAKRYAYRYLAMVYVTRGTGIEGDHGQMLKCQRASLRFSAIADAIERGEK